MPSYAGIEVCRNFASSNVDISSLFHPMLLLIFLTHFGYNAFTLSLLLGLQVEKGLDLKVLNFPEHSVAKNEPRRLLTRGL